jgi:hypothetical protein
LGGIQGTIKSFGISYIQVQRFDIGISFSLRIGFFLIPIGRIIWGIGSRKYNGPKLWRNFNIGTEIVYG